MVHQHHHHLHRRDMHQRGIRDAIASAFADPFGLAAPAPAPTAKDQDSPGSTTIVVYVTATPTFAGPIASYSTALGAPLQFTQSSSSSDSSSTSSSSTSNSDSSTSTSSSTSSTSSSSSSSASSTSSPSTTSTDSSSSSSSTSSVVAQTTAMPSTTVSAADSTSSPSAAASQGSSSGLGTAAIAGLALGGLVLVGAVLALVLICLKRKRRAAYLKADDEKSPFGPSSEFKPSERAASVRTTRTTSTAPRLSLRPVTQFLPHLGDDNQRQQQISRPGDMAMAPASAQTPQNRYSWDAPMNNANDPANPFGSHAETGSHHSSPTSSIISGTPHGSTEAPIELSSVFPTAGGAAPVELDSTVAPIAAAGATVGAGAVAAQRSNNNPQSPGRSTPSPTGSDRSHNAPSTASGAPPPPVHRVQLDFKPSMDDEMELRAGQLVRMLKEYDDGWALCVRMDRSQQGVAPRTCLSAKSVKPRPNNAPPSNINSRVPPPGMRVPQQGRPMSPGSASPVASSPSSSRSPSSPQAPPRAMSPSQQSSRRNSPPGSSPMNPTNDLQPIQRVPTILRSGSPAPNSAPLPTRKPVPGQAL